VTRCRNSPKTFDGEIEARIERDARALLDAVPDQAFDLLGCLGASLRQAAHFGGHDGKATALLAGASSASIISAPSH
jgi:hypothetical protein